MTREDEYRCGKCGGVHRPDEPCDPPKEKGPQGDLNGKPHCSCTQCHG